MLGYEDDLRPDCIKEINIAKIGEKYKLYSFEVEGSSDLGPSCPKVL